MSCSRYALILTLLLPLGCQPAESSKPSDSGKAKQNEQTQEKAAPAENITLQVKSWDELQEWVKEQNGKLVVVDVWSTSCPPCVAELPKLAELQKKHGDQVACAAFSIDFTGKDHLPPQSLQDQVLAVLKKKQVTGTTNFLSSDNDEQVTGKIDVVAIPAALVYDRQGELVKLFKNDEGEYGDAGYTYVQHVMPLVEKLVAEKPATK